MKKVWMDLMLVVSLVVSGCGVEPESERAPEEEAQAQAVEVKPLTTWHDEGTESCADINNGLPCTNARPSPQCPSAVHGRPCTPQPNRPFCWKVVDQSSVKMFGCY